ncbi:uncharacterized protein PG986_012332 [Apiospora aurea]|uniref:Uncharacterized protein n=1 Tax=Apiospora aurea TaxID=335848 RepID=A0ABR1PZN7_9PEZI
MVRLGSRSSDNDNTRYRVSAGEYTVPTEKYPLRLHIRQRPYWGPWNPLWRIRGHQGGAVRDVCTKTLTPVAELGIPRRVSMGPPGPRRRSLPLLRTAAHFSYEPDHYVDYQDCKSPGGSSTAYGDRRPLML